MDSHLEQIPAELLKVSSVEDVTPELLALARQHCAGRLSRAWRKTANPLNSKSPLWLYSVMIGRLCSVVIPGELAMLTPFTDAEAAGMKPATETPQATAQRPEWGKRGLGSQNDMMLEGGYEKGGQMTLLSSLDQPNESPKYDAEKIKAATAYARDEVAATPADKLRAIGKEWLKIGKRDDSHQLEKNLTGKIVPQLVGQLHIPMKVEALENSPHPSLGYVHSWKLEANGGWSYILEKGGMVWVDTSATGGLPAYLDPTTRPKAGAGPAVYQVAQAFARNTGRKFIPDPEGVSPIAEPRRWAQMLSSLLRFGDAKHLEPVDMKNSPELPGWSDKLSPEEAAGRFAMAEYAYVKKWLSEIESLQISADGTTILDSDGHSLGTNPGRAFEGLLSGGRDPRVTGIGPTTLIRALITRMAATGHPVDFK